MTSKEVLLRTGSSPLRPRARLVQAMGEDLISNQIVALVELIKNAYDADANSVEVKFEPPLLPGKGSIRVKDDGHGMSLETLQTAWMEPATSSKKYNRFSPQGRRVTGEKGLGRFAAARLAKRMHLESTAKDSGRRVVADFNWEDFKRDDRYLDQIQCTWSEFDSSDDSQPGTTLLLSDLRDEWTVDAFRRLRGELSRLVVRQEDEDPFIIDLALPSEFLDLAGPVTLPQILYRPHYILRGRMLKNGSLTASLAVGDKERVLKSRIRLKNGRAPKCGPFSFEFKVWDRDELGPLASDLDSTITELRRDLNEAAGVSIYRDSFRVLPYGASSNDWLRLDLRRVQNPTMRLSNNQIVGSIYITADENPELRDQTNREGIVESQALEDLKACAGELLAHIEGARYELRRKGQQLASQRSLFEALDLAPVRAAFAAKYPKDREFLHYLEDKDQELKSSVGQIQEVIVRYRRLATLGQIVDTVLHDGRTPIASISNQCTLAQRDLDRSTSLDDTKEKTSKRLQTILAQTDVLSALFQRISPFSGRKRGKPQEHTLEKLISDSFELLRERTQDLGVKLDMPRSKTLARVDGTDVQQIIVNLLDNSLYWLSKIPRDQRQIAVRVNQRQDGIEILFSDSGPGVPENIRDFIFEPYFSSRPEGVGLGLTITGELVSEYEGSLELVEPGILPGANFRIWLKAKN